MSRFPMTDDSGLKCLGTFFKHRVRANLQNRCLSAAFYEAYKKFNFLRWSKWPVEQVKKFKVSGWWTRWLCVLSLRTFQNIVLCANASPRWWALASRSLKFMGIITSNSPLIIIGWWPSNCAARRCDAVITWQSLAKCTVRATWSNGLLSKRKLPEDSSEKNLKKNHQKIARRMSNENVDLAVAFRWDDTSLSAHRPIKTLKQ